MAVRMATEGPVYPSSAAWSYCRGPSSKEGQMFCGHCLPEVSEERKEGVEGDTLEAQRCEYLEQRNVFAMT